MLRTLDGGLSQSDGGIGMEKNYNVTEAVQAQREYCKEFASKHPEDWMAESMAKGVGVAPASGICWSCGQQIYEKEGREMSFGRIRRPTGRTLTGISVEEARTRLTTGCPFCHRSFVD